MTPTDPRPCGGDAYRGIDWQPTRSGLAEIVRGFAPQNCVNCANGAPEAWGWPGGPLGPGKCPGTDPFFLGVALKVAGERAETLDILIDDGTGWETVRDDWGWEE